MASGLNIDASVEYLITTYLRDFQWHPSSVWAQGGGMARYIWIFMYL